MSSLNQIQRVATRVVGSRLMALGGTTAAAAVAVQLALGGTALETVAPTELNFNGYWRASYSGAPWTPTATRGFSGVNGNLDDATPATVGAASNGFTSADLNGTTQTLTTQSVVKNDLFQNNAGTIGVLFKPRSAAAPNVNTFSDVRLFADTGVNFGLHYSSAGIKGAIFDGTSWVYTAAVAVPAAAYALAQMRWNGSVLEVRVNNGAWASVSCTGIDPGAGNTALSIGGNFGATLFLDATVLEIMAANVVHTTANLDGVWLYAQNRYALNASTTPITGTAGFTFGQSGSLLGAGKLVGSSAVTFGQSGTLLGAGSLAGTASLTFAMTGTGLSNFVSLSNIAGTAGFTFGQSGSLAGSGTLTGTSTVVFAQSGTLLGSASLVGTSPIAFAQSGSLKGAGALVGSSAIAFGQTGSLLGVGKLTGSSPIAFGQTGSLKGTASLVGTSGFTFAMTGTGLANLPAGPPVVVITQDGVVSMLSARSDVVFGPTTQSGTVSLLSPRSDEVT